jgi:hypothetical protein
MTFFSDYIRDLHLRPDSPYPSEVRDGHDLVLRRRRACRLRLVPPDNTDGSDSDGDDPVDDGIIE